MKINIKFGNLYQLIQYFRMENNLFTVEKKVVRPEFRQDVLKFVVLNITAENRPTIGKVLYEVVNLWVASRISNG